MDQGDWVDLLDPLGKPRFHYPDSPNLPDVILQRLLLLHSVQFLNGKNLLRMNRLHGLGLQNCLLEDFLSPNLRFAG